MTEHLNKPPQHRPEKDMSNNTLDTAIKIGLLVLIILAILYFAN